MSIKQPGAFADWYGNPLVQSEILNIKKQTKATEIEAVITFLLLQNGIALDALGDEMAGLAQVLDESNEEEEGEPWEE